MHHVSLLTKQKFLIFVKIVTFFKDFKSKFFDQFFYYNKKKVICKRKLKKRTFFFQYNEKNISIDKKLVS